jgi:HEPN domain-containing protein
MRQQVIWYLATANEDDRAVRVLVKKGEFAKAAFHCQQMAEKAFKALIARREQVPPDHDLLGLMHFLERGDHCEIPEEVREKAQRLDRFYIHIRHPKREAGQLHGSYTIEIIKELHNSACTIMSFAEDHLEEEITLASDVGV